MAAKEWGAETQVADDEDDYQNDADEGDDGANNGGDGDDHPPPGAGGNVLGGEEPDGDV